MNLTVKNRNEIDSRFKWNLEQSFTEAEWNNEFSAIQDKISMLKNFQSKLNSQESLKDFLELDEEISRKLHMVYQYANLKKDEDAGVNENVQKYNKVQELYSGYCEESAFFTPEILTTSMEYIDDFIKNNPEYISYKLYFEDIFESKKHTLSQQEEELIALLAKNCSSPKNVAEILTVSDMTFKTIEDSNGEVIQLSEGNYANLITSKDRDIRQKASDSLFEAYLQYESTLGRTLVDSMSLFNVQAKIRKYSSFVDYILKPNKIPSEVLFGTIDTIKENVHLIHEYFAMKKDFLNLDTQFIYDIYCPLMEDIDDLIEYDDALDLVRKSLSILGSDYIEKLEKILSSSIIDVYPNKKKRGGAYSSGTYDGLPYILLNYSNKLEDVQTLTHELGHSINTLYVNENQPYITSGTSIFCAEVASTVNQILLSKYMLQNTTDIKKKINILYEFIEEILGTVFAQIRYSEFELDIHKRLQNKEPLTGEDLSTKWLELLKDYYGDSVVVEEKSKIGWARIPHFYRDFYVYKYATGYIAATQFATNILNKKDNAVEDYIRFLSSGTSDYPTEILKKSGVDLTSPEPAEALINILKESISELKELLNQI